MLIDIIKLRNLAADTTSFEVKGPLDSLVIGGEVINLIDPVKVKGTIHHTGRTFQVAGTITARIQRVCGRCLNTYTEDIATEFQVEYCRATEVLPDDRADEREDFEVFQGGSIDLTERIRETLYLTIPMRPLCAEDCQGMCPQCGQDFNQGKCQCRNDNFDPRLQVLGKLLKS